MRGCNTLQIYSNIRRISDVALLTAGQKKIVVGHLRPFLLEDTELGLLLCSCGPANEREWYDAVGERVL